MTVLGADVWTGLQVRPVQTFTALGAGLLGGAAVWPETVFGRLGVWAALATFAAAAAFAMEEAALDLARSTPRAASRWVAKVALALLPLGSAMAALALVAQRGSTVVWWVAVVELVGLLLVAAAATTALAGRLPAPAERVSEGVAMAVLVASLGNPAGRWVEVLPLDDAGRWARTGLLWAGVTVVSLLLLVRGLRDPLSTSALSRSRLGSSRLGTFRLARGRTPQVRRPRPRPPHPPGPPAAPGPRPSAAPPGH